MRCVFSACDTYCCLCTVCPLLSRITQDTIQPTDTASNRATSTPMPAVELSVHVDLSLSVNDVLGNGVVSPMLVDGVLQITPSSIKELVQCALTAVHSPPVHSSLCSGNAPGGNEFGSATELPACR